MSSVHRFRMALAKAIGNNAINNACEPEREVTDIGHALEYFIAHMEKAGKSFGSDVKLDGTTLLEFVYYHMDRVSEILEHD